MSISKNILFIGLNTVDLQFLVSEYPESNSKVKATKNEIYTGGPATNAAICAAHLGSKASLITPIGVHSLSDFIKDDISRYGVNVFDPISGTKAKPVFASIVTSEVNGDRTIFSYHPPVHKITPESILVEGEKYDIVLFDGFYPEISVPLAKYFKSKKITTVFDGGSWKPALPELLPYIDIAICSADFFPPGCKNINETLLALKEFGIKKTAITRGDKEIVVNQAGKVMHIAVNKTEVIDTLGAGDIFHGAFCHYYSQENDFIDSLQKASELASESCKSFGTRDWMVDSEVSDLVE